MSLPARIGGLKIGQDIFKPDSELTGVLGVQFELSAPG